MTITETTIPKQANTSGSKPTASSVTSAGQVFDQAIQRLSGWLNRHSIEVLRVSLGVVFLVFGALKFIPGASPAQALVVRTLETLSFGMLSGPAALLLTAVAECVIGVTLIAGRFLRVGLLVLAASLVGIMSPLVLFWADLVPGAPTLEAQYVFKDIVLAAAGMVVAARALGGKLVSTRQ